jgi:hypothetical protein
MVRKIAIFAMVFLLLGLMLPGITADSGPELEVEILTGPHFPSPSFRVVNIGDEAVHNLRLTDTIVDGKILYNNRDMNMKDILEPDERDIASVNSWFFGFGIFSVTVTVTCDEGVFSSDVTNGFIIGSLVLIP